MREKDFIISESFSKMQKIGVVNMPLAGSAGDRGSLPGIIKPLVPEEQGSGYIADKTVKAEKRIQVYPYDTEAWSILIRDAQMKKIEDARVIYERLVEQFPNAGKYWKIYIEHEVYDIYSYRVVIQK